MLNPASARSSAPQNHVQVLTCLQLAQFHCLLAIKRSFATLIKCRIIVEPLAGPLLHFSSLFHRSLVMQDLEKRNTTHSEGVISDGVSEKTVNATSSVTGLTFAEERKRAVKKLVRKLDVVILPLTALLYLSAYLVCLGLQYLLFSDLACRTAVIWAMLLVARSFLETS